MAKNAVITISIGSEFAEISKLSSPTFKAYADKIGADFIVLDQEKINGPTGCWELLQIYELLLSYERLIYFDADTIVREDCPDLFKLVPKDQLGAFNEGKWVDRSQDIMSTAQALGISQVSWDNKYYNAGVLVISRGHRKLFKTPAEWVELPSQSQSYLNFKIMQEEINVYQLGYKFNRMEYMDSITGESRKDSYIIHYSGVPELSFVNDIMKRDIDDWVENGPEFKYKKHIVVEVEHGLGDNIAAEPTIRYMTEKLYPNDDITILTDFPRIFKHINAKVFKRDQYRPTHDGGHFHIFTHPGTVSQMWSTLRFLLCHTVDYISICCLKRILPIKDKEIWLQVDQQDLDYVKAILGDVDPKDLVLVHAGKHIEINTFPTEWWQEIIDKLQAAGKTVCLVGKSAQALCYGQVVDIVAREGMIDTRDLLDIGELIALCSIGKIMLANESGPIVVCSAFDNWMVLISTREHPEHVFPWRHGTQDYKTKALYKKLIVDDLYLAPTDVRPEYTDVLPPGIDFLPPGHSFDEYLPDPDEVVNAILEIE